MAAAVYEDLLAEARKAAAKIGDEAMAAGRACNVRMSLSSPETADGDLEFVAGAAGQTADLVIVGQPVEGEHRSEANALLTGALFGSGRPVLMLPRRTRPYTVGTRILVAWKPTREASRAVHDALPMLRSAASVRLFTGADESKGRREYLVELDGLSRHLEAHGVTMSEREAGPPPREITVLEEAERWGADLIVMGAYGHSRLQETIFGGVTRDVIRNSQVAVLLSH
jgi:nucleotide-binding universal stress UspA family protein